MGLDPNLAALLSYLLGIVGGLVFFLVEKKNTYVRFHAMQSVLLFAAFVVGWVVLIVLGIVLSYLPCLGSIVSSLLGLALWLGYVVLWIVMMIKAYQGEKYKLPVIGDMAEKQAG